MIDTVTAPAGQEPTAIAYTRVLVLTEEEQRAILNGLAAANDDAPRTPGGQLYRRVLYGEEFVNPLDELVRETQRKRQLEAEIRKINQRIAQVEAQVIDDLVDQGSTSTNHAATGASVSMRRQVWAKVVRAGEKATPEEKAAAAEALQRAGLGEFVKPDFNTTTVSAHFRELINGYDAEQQSLPEHERVARDAASFLPPELDGYLELDDTPKLSVRF